MLNRIRRAVSLTRARRFPKGRHRRLSTPLQSPTAPAFPALANEPAVALGQALDSTNHWHSLAGEDSALVRPYVLCWEKSVRTRAVVVAPHLPAKGWTTVAGVN